ncbi:uncharacterized protein METZ01_LOCUS135297 [marine metagenome]|uniref:Uncharacterized protein n=1 Tax=marine metagenome TaxID=408172 RepID=A0A381Z0U7_9ZZZZ
MESFFGMREKKIPNAKLKGTIRQLLENRNRVFEKESEDF